MFLYNRRLAFPVIVFTTVLLLYGYADYAFGDDALQTFTGVKHIMPSKATPLDVTCNPTIPAIYHFVIGAAGEEAPIKLNFLAFLAIYSAKLHMPNAEIWLHTNASTNYIDRALSLEGLSPPVYHEPGDGHSRSKVAETDSEYDEYWTQAVVKGVPNIVFKQISKEYSPTPSGKVVCLPISAFRCKQC